MQACRQVKAQKAFAGPRRSTVVVRAQQQRPHNVVQSKLSRASGAVLLAAATLALNLGPALDPSALMLQPAHAEDEVSEESLTPYQRRQREMERRREMLRTAREQAEAKAGDSSTPSTADADAAVEAANASRAATAERLGSELKSSAASTYESTTGTTRYKGFGGYNAPTPAPAPAPAAEPEPAPAPAPRSFFSSPAPKPAPVVVEVKKEEPKKEVKKEEPKKQEPAGKQKRRGPLPLFLAEVLVLGSFAGVFAAFTKYGEQTNKALLLAGEKVKELYAVAEQAAAKAK